MKAGNLIDAIRLPFRKDRQLYRSFYGILGFYPRRIELYRQALTHKSLSVKAEGKSASHNERLEYLGDAILDAVVGDILYNHFQGEREGFLTSVRSRVVQRETLGNLADQMGLTDLVQSNLMSKTHNSYMAGNAFEALVGAVYLDRGYKYCKWFVKNRILGKYINLDKIAYRESNFKSKLLEWCQKYRVEAKFELLEEKKDQETLSPQFLSRVLVSGVECGRGMGYSKKESHQRAAEMALARLKKNSSLKKKVLQEVNKTNNGTNTDTTSVICAEKKDAGQISESSRATTDGGAPDTGHQG